MSYLLDTNILLRLVEPTHPMHEPACQAVEALTARAEVLYVAPQNIIEFWAIATRPVVNRGLGFTPERAQSEAERIERTYTLAPDNPVIYQEWRRLVVAYSVLGMQAHDARLIAVMRVRRIENILTFNVTDFNRFSAGEGITVVDPASVSPPGSEPETAEATEE